MISHARWVFCLLCLLAMAAATPACAYDEVLSFRASQNGFEAVIDGISDGPGCNPEFQQPSSIEVEAASIAIVSPEDPLGCFIPLGPRPYQVIAELGSLSGSRYDVVWSQEGKDPMTGVLVPSGAEGSVPVAAPMLSRAWLVAFALALLAVGLFSLLSSRGAAE